MTRELIIERDRFLYADNRDQFDWFGHIDFMLFWKSLADGFPIEPHLAGRIICPGQVVVTLMMAHFIEHRDPDSQGERFFQHIKPFAKALDNLDCYWMPIVFADMQVFGWSVDKQRSFLTRCADQFNNEKNVIPSLGNELSKNGIKASDFGRPTSNNYWSRGSEVGDEPPPRPGWDWNEFHPRRDWPKVIWGCDDSWYVKEGIHNDVVIDSPMPCICTEPIGFWDRDIPNHRSSDPNLARAIGGNARYSARGVNFMSQEGLRCEDWTPRTRECAERMMIAMKQP